MYRPSLNHAYRLVWSDVTQSYVAVAEHTKSHGKSKALSLAIALALAPAISMAEPGGPPITFTDNAVYTVNLGEVLELNAPGTVLTIIPDQGAYTESFSNAGSIRVNVTNIENGTYGEQLVRGVAVTAVDGLIANNGTISADIDAGVTSSGALATGIEIGALGGKLTNNGKITATAKNAIGVSGGDYIPEGSSSHAIGAAVKGDIVASGTFSNISLAVISAESLAPHDSFAYGVSVSGELLGKLENAGIIGANANSSDYGIAKATGIHLDGAVSVGGALINKTGGSIAATAESAYDADAIGIYIGGSLGGAFSNSGNISADATTLMLGEGAPVNAGGVSISGDIAGSFTNAGIIDADANGGSYSGAMAYGVHVSGALDGTLTNSGAGTILANASGYNAKSAGISIHDNVFITGSLSNNGHIEVDAIAHEDGMAEAHGIDVYGNVDGTVSNAGTIEVGVKSSQTYNFDNYEDPTEAVGIYIDGDVNGSVINAANGSITTTAFGNSVQAAGMVVNEGSISGSLINAANASIAASAEGTYAVAAGMVAFGDTTSEQKGSITNKGSIEANAASVLMSQVIGIGVQGMLSADILNTGTITASASTSGILIDPQNWAEGMATAAGIQVNAYLEGNISNTGTINASVTGADGGEGSASGIMIGGGSSIQGNITNSKIINASATINADTTLSGGLGITGTRGIATGIRIGQDAAISGNILNSETINASITMTGASEADSHSRAMGFAVGIMIEDDAYVDGNLDNHKTISADVAIADGAEGSAGGILVRGNLNGDFNNAGMITADAHGNINGDGYGNGGLAFAEGASFYNLAGNMSNSGAIEATAKGTFAIATGVTVYQDSHNFAGLALAPQEPTVVVTNSSTGVISAKAQGGLANAGGLSVNDVYSDQKIVNDGRIMATANSAIEANGTFIGGFASATGVYIDNLDGKLDNTGTIGAFAVTADGGEGAAAIGINVEYLNGGTINNSGTVIASYAADGGEGNSISIYSGEGGGTINNKASGKLIGGIDIQASGVTLHNDGQLILKNGVSLNSVANTGAATYGYIAGNYNQGATGVLHIAAESNQEGGYSQLEVGGTASINGKAFVDVKSVNTLAIGQTLENVVSAGSLSGDFVSVADNSALFGFQSKVDGNTIDFVTIKDKTVTESVNNRGNRPGNGAATAIDRVIDSGSGSESMKQIVSEIGKLSTEAEVSEAVSQLLPLLTSGTSQSITGAVNGASRIVQARQEGQVGRSSGDGFFGDKKMWFKPFGSWADQDERNGVSGYESDTYGMVFGIDSELSTINRVGLAFAYSKTDVDGKGTARQGADVDSYQLIGYASRSLSEATDINFQVGLGMHTNKGHRDMTVGALTGTATSKFDSWSANLGVGIAHTMKLSEATSFTPSARVDYSMIRSETYDETGRGDLAAVALEDVNSRDTEALVVGVDGKVVHAFNDRTSLTANVGVGYDLLNERASTTATFAGSPDIAFTTKGLDPSPWLTRGGLGVVGKVTDTMEVTARYDFEVREDFNNQTVSVKARWSF